MYTSLPNDGPCQRCIAVGILLLQRLQHDTWQGSISPSRFEHAIKRYQGGPSSTSYTLLTLSWIYLQNLVGSYSHSP